MGLKEPLCPPEVRCKFGAEILDRCVGEFDMRSMIIFAGPSGSGKSVVLNNIILYHLALDHDVIYVTLDDDPVSSIERINLIAGGNVAQDYIKAGKLRIVDGFSFRIAVPKPSREYISRELTSLDVDDFFYGIKQEASSVAKGSLLIIDSYNEILNTVDIAQSTELLKNIRATVSKGLEILTLVVVHTDSEEIAEWIKGNEYWFDGLIIFNLQADPLKGKVTRFIFIKKVKGASHCTDPIYYKIEGGKPMLIR